MKIVLGHKIQELREAKGWTRKQLADSINSFSSTIYSIEKGQYKTTNYLKAIAKILECNIDDISTYKTSENTCKTPNCRNKKENPQQVYCRKCARARHQKNAKEYQKKYKAKKAESKAGFYICPDYSANNGSGAYVNKFLEANQKRC